MVLSVPFLTFLIDAYTGERIDASLFSQIYVDETQALDMDEIMMWRRRHISHMQNLDDNALMFYMNFSQEELAVYTEIVLEMAQQHFVNSTVVHVMLGQIINDAENIPMLMPGINLMPIRTDDGEIITVINGLTFTVMDDTGREAMITMSTEYSNERSISISTHHNDFMPRFTEWPNVHSFSIAVQQDD